MSHSPAEAARKFSPPSYEVITDTPVGNLGRFDWYHGSVNKEEAEAALSAGRGNMFMVRVEGTNLVLSRTVNGCVSHENIQWTPDRYYKLEGMLRCFKSFPDMMEYYQAHPVDHSRESLGIALSMAKGTLGKINLSTMKYLNARFFQLLLTGLPQDSTATAVFNKKVYDWFLNVNCPASIATFMASIHI